MFLLTKIPFSPLDAVNMLQHRTRSGKGLRSIRRPLSSSKVRFSDFSSIPQLAQVWCVSWLKAKVISTFGLRNDRRSRTTYPLWIFNCTMMSWMCKRDFSAFRIMKVFDVGHETIEYVMTFHYFVGARFLHKVVCS